MADSDNVQVGAALGGSFKCCICGKKHQKLEGQLNVGRCWEKLQDHIFQYHCGWGYGICYAKDDKPISLDGRITGIIDHVCPDEMRLLPSGIKYLLAAPSKVDALAQFDVIYLQKIEELKEEVRRQLVSGEAKIKTQFQVKPGQREAGALRVKEEWFDPTWKDWDLILGDERMAQEAMGLAFQGVPIDVRPISQGYRGAVLYCVKKRPWIKSFNTRYGNDHPPYGWRVDYDDEQLKNVNQQHIDHLGDVLITSKGSFRLGRQLDTIKEAEKAPRLTAMSATETYAKDAKRASEDAGCSYLGDAWRPPAQTAPVVSAKRTSV